MSPRADTPASRPVAQRGTSERRIIAGAKRIIDTLGEIAFPPHPPSPPRRIVVFTRYPQPGTTKTRMIPALGGEGAASLQRDMTEHTVNEARCAASGADTTLEIQFAGGGRLQMSDWLGSDLVYRDQTGDDLGQRMASAFVSSFRSGSRSTIVTGTDCPSLNSGVMSQALDELEAHDAVIGPAADGGYYLIGLRSDVETRAIPGIFDGVEWGTSNVLNRTLESVDRCGLSLAVLEELSDVDVPEDLHVWDETKTKRNSQHLSIVIPTLNERERIASVVSGLAGSGVEVIVSDGGSRDGTQQAASDAGATVCQTARGRGAQMNAGAREAAGDILLFLHADTTLPDDFATQIVECLARPCVVAGSFRFGVEDTSGGMTHIKRLVDFRTRAASLPYGDQGLFLTSSVFRKMGGFRPLPIMEDIELVRRLKRIGRIATAPGVAITSSRRWQRHGVFGMTLRNQLALLAYVVGVTPNEIASWYQGPKSRRGKT